MSQDSLLEIHNLQKFSGASLILDIESFSLAAGEINALVGPVGSGKSTLLSLLTGQSTPSSGLVRICGLDPRRDHTKLSSRLGVLFQQNSLYERLTVRENLTFYCSLHDLPASRAVETLVAVGLADQASFPAGKLPSNLARRLAFGRAVLHFPQVLLLYEPFSGCDAASASLLSRLIFEQASTGTAVLILAREEAGLATLCRSVYLLEQGRPVLLEMLKADSRGELPFKIPVRQEGQVVLLNPADILFATTAGDQTCLHTNRGQVPSQLSLGELETRLSRNGFFRAHRGYLVNLQRVMAILPYTRDSFTLILDDPDNTEIPLSKSAARELRDLLGY